LVIDTLEEGMEVAAELPGVFSGVPLVVLLTLLTLLGLVGMERLLRRGRDEASRLGTSYRIALGIGLHNLGEGLAIGAAFAAGEAALGSFLIIGFTLHNITEGIGIAAPLLKSRPTAKTFLALAILGGGPAIIGTWVGGFVFNQTLAALFFGIGAGAIVQVIYVISKMIVKDAKVVGAPTVSWLNFSSLTLGILLMYVTALLVN